jgi:1-acyl-sn-glycerol-3-phosphate acyltransferase
VHFKGIDIPKADSFTFAYMRNLINVIQIMLIGFSTAVCAVLAGLVALIDRDRAVFYGTRLWSKSLAYICGMELHAYYAGNADEGTPKIYVANHLSHMDIPALLLTLNVPIYFVAKQELKQIPFLGWFMQLVGMIFIDRSNKERALEELAKAAAEVKGGKNILTFPEGTRSQTGEMGLFKRGTFMMALENDIDIVPVAVMGTGNVIPARSFEIRSGNVSVCVGSPIRIQEVKHLNPEQLAEYTRQEVQRLQAWSTIQSGQFA